MPKSKFSAKKAKKAKINKTGFYGKYSYQITLFGLLVLLAGGIFLYSSYAGGYANVQFSNIWVGKITPGSGHIGVDIWWNENDGIYNPCHDSSLYDYGACVMSDVGQISYYKVFGYGPNKNEYPYGIFIDNYNDNYCKTSDWCHSKDHNDFKHNWGKRVTGASLEIYPYGENGQYQPINQDVGGLRVRIDGFPVYANNGRYSGYIGDIRLPKLGEKNVGKLNGFFTKNNQKITQGKASVDMFENSTTFYSSNGVPLSGFSSVPSNDDGYYTSGAIPNGFYKVYITDVETGRKVILENVQISHDQERIDFNLDQRCFGHPDRNCEDSWDKRASTNSFK